MVRWQGIRWVLLDMDGTLLDLHFDTHFWFEHLPQRYAERHGMGLDAAKAELYPRLRRVEGTMAWYCLDYWSRELGLDVAALKHEVQHLIAVRPHVHAFLEAARGHGRRVLLVTNAHRASLSLKLERTGLAASFHAVVCAHDLGLPKEDPRFWERLRGCEPFDPARTVLVDDNPAVLHSARRHGVAHLVAVRRPDSRGPRRAGGEFPAIESFLDIMPGGGGRGHADAAPA